MDTDTKASQSPAEVASATSWASYFYPRKTGYTCTLAEEPLVTELPGDKLTITNQETNTVRSVGTTADGLTYTIANTAIMTSTHSDPSVAAEAPSRTATQTSFVVTPSGKIDAPQQDVRQSDVEFDFQGFVVYPTVEELKAGIDQTSSVIAAISSTSPAVQSELRPSIADGTNSLRFKLDFKVAGLGSKTITTPAGTFRDTVGMMITITSAAPLNAVSGSVTANQLTSALKTLVSSTEVWWARGVGRIEKVQTSVFGKDVMRLASCS